jgi:hypothetical protein
MVVVPLSAPWKLNHQRTMKNKTRIKLHQKFGPDWASSEVLQP